MNRRHLLIIYLIVGLFVCAANSQETNRTTWNPNTRKLDLSAKIGDPVTKEAGVTLARDVKNFYELLRDKQWHKTYELRAKAFRHGMTESDYLAKAKRVEKRWGLVNYDVLSVDMCNSVPGSTNIDQATLICRFVELPDYEESYSTVFWHKEDGVWKCLSAGPHKLGIFSGLRPPIIDWR